MYREFGENVLAELANITLHVIHPLQKHEHQCSCLLCNNSNSLQEAKTSLVRTRMVSALVHLPTANDNDLIKTESSCHRQLIVFDQGETKQSGLLRQLQTYIQFKLCSNSLPSLDLSLTNAPLYHILVVTSKDVLDQGTKEWVKHVFANNIAKKIVLVVPESDTTFGSPMLGVTCILYKPTFYLKTLQILTHAMMVMKQRLMPKDLHRFMGSDIATITTLQQGYCLFF